jgi:uncharacterized membrane protein
MTMTQDHPVRRGQKYKRLLLGLVAVGVVALIGGMVIDQHLAGLVVYAVGALGALAVTLYGQFSDSITFMDERDQRLHERASNATVSVVSYVGLPTVVALYLLDATGRFEIGPALWGGIWTLSGFYLLWGVVYLGLRYRS